MTEKELYTQITSKLTVELPDLFKTILEEACENACNSKTMTDDKSKKFGALVAFVTAANTLKTLVKATLANNFDTINLNYRGKSFVIDQSHPILKLDLSGIL